MAMSLSQFVIAVGVFLFTDAASFITPKFNSVQGPLCKRDLLLILDTSYSVGERNFNTQVKPFLETLVTDKDLNVRHNGTQISLMVFSDYSDPKSRGYRAQYDKTKVLIDFSDKFDGPAIKEYIKGLKWSDVKGGHTRTDIALEIANTKIFPLENPLNNRDSANDMIVIITDGKPQGTHRAAKNAIANAEKLKKKNIKIIGIGVGKKIRNRHFWRTLQTISSSGQAIRKDFDKLQTVKKWLEKKSCGIAASRCFCPVTRSAPYYLKPSESSAKVSWLPPTPSCSGSDQHAILRTTVEPALTSPQHFRVGKHEIRYKYQLKNGPEVQCLMQFEVKACSCRSLNLVPIQVMSGQRTAKVRWNIPVPNCLNYKMPVENKHLTIGFHSIEYQYNIDKSLTLTCKVTVEVKGALCSDTPYDSFKQVCCWGAIHEKKANFECCGQHYYDISRKKCCSGLNIRKKGEPCPMQ